MLQVPEVPLRYRVTIREFHEWHDTTLVSFSARIPTSQRSICRPLSPQPKPGLFASHVGGGGSGDCQSLADFLATLLAVVLSIQVANVVLTTVVADHSEARISPLKLWPTWHLRLMLLLYRSHGNCRSPGVVHRQRIQEGCTEGPQA